MLLGVTVAHDQLVGGPEDVRTFAQACERAGYDYVTALDHVLGADSASRPGYDGFYDHSNSFREPLVFLGFIAGAAPGLGLATSVLVLPQRQTALVAKQVAELDLLTEGRMRLCVGIGWNDVEYDALGMGFADRADRYEEQVEVLRRLWSEPVVSFAGRHHSIDRAGLLPLPTARRVPLWMGGGTAPRVLERIGRLADGWVTMGHFQRPNGDTRAALATIREAAERAGRDIDAFGLEGRVHLVDGKPAESMRAEADAWLALGATHISLHGLPQHRPVEEYVDLIGRSHALLSA